MTNDLPAIQDMRSDHRIPTEAVKSLESHHPGSPDAIDQLGDGYYELDSTFRYRRVNPAGARLAQKSPEDLLGKHVLDVFPEVETSEVHQAVRRVMASRRPEQVETYY